MASAKAKHLAKFALVVLGILFAAPRNSTRLLAAPQSPLLSAYQADDCAAVFADALRLSDLATAPHLPARLALPEWSNPGGISVPLPGDFIRLLCRRVNDYCGAAVSFEFDRALGDVLWKDHEAIVYPTTLTLEPLRKKRKAELVLAVLDPRNHQRLVEVRHSFSVSRELFGGPIQVRAAPSRLPSTPVRERTVPPTLAPPSDRAKSQSKPPQPSEDDRPAARRGPDKLARSSRLDVPKRGETPLQARDGADAAGSGHSSRIRPCRLHHVTAMPEDQDVERESDLECGRILFLDRKSSERLEPISDICRWTETGELIVEIEMVCTRKEREIRIWAEFFDQQGRGVNRTRELKSVLREGRIRAFRFESVLPAEQVVVFLEKD